MFILCRKRNVEVAIETAMLLPQLQIERAFTSFDCERKMLHNIRYRNLIKTVSCCSEVDFKVLVVGTAIHAQWEPWEVAAFSEAFFEHPREVEYNDRCCIGVGIPSSWLLHTYCPMWCEAEQHNPRPIILWQMLLISALQNSWGKCDSMTWTMTPSHN